MIRLDPGTDSPHPRPHPESPKVPRVITQGNIDQAFDQAYQFFAKEFAEDFGMEPDWVHPEVSAWARAYARNVWRILQP